MTQEDAIKAVRKQNQLLKIITILLIIIVVIVGAYVGIGLYWAEHQQRYVPDVLPSLVPTNTPNHIPTITPISTPNYTPIPTSIPSATPKIYLVRIDRSYLVMDGGTFYRIPLIARTFDSPSPVIFTNEDILINDTLGSSYGSYAPQLLDSLTVTPISHITIGANGGIETFEIRLPKGDGSPWVSGESIKITLKTSTAEGSITVSLP